MNETKSVVIKVERRAVLAMQKIASTDSSRYIINAVGFEVTDEQVILVATDGKILGALRTGQAENAPTNPVTYPIQINTAMLRALPLGKSAGMLQIVIEDNTAVIKPLGERTSFEAEILPGKFPIWRRVTPTESPRTPIDPAFNYELLEKFIAFHKAYTKAPAYIELSQTGEDYRLNPMLVRLQHAPEFFGVLMPLRSDGDSFSPPDWAKLTGEEGPSNVRTR